MSQGALCVKIESIAQLFLKLTLCNTPRVLTTLDSAAINGNNIVRASDNGEGHGGLQEERHKDNTVRNSTL